MAFSGLVRDVRFDTAGLGASRWNDNGGRDNHLPHTAGSHAVSTVGGYDAWTPATDSTIYTEFTPVKPFYSIIMAIYHNSTTNPVNYWWTSGADSGAPYATDDHAAATEPATWTDQDASYIRTNNTSVIAGCISGGSATGTISVGAWSIVTATFDPYTLTKRIQVNDGTPVVTSLTWAQARQEVGHRARLGYFNASATINASCSYGRFIEVEGDVIQEQSSEFATQIAALKTQFGIT